MTLEINSRRKNGKFINKWKLNNTLLNNQVQRKLENILKHFIKNKTYQNLLVAAKAVLKGKFIVINIYTKKGGEFQINNLILYFKELKKEKQTKPKLAEGMK